MPSQKRNTKAQTYSSFAKGLNTVVLPPQPLLPQMGFMLEAKKAILKFILWRQNPHWERPKHHQVGQELKTTQNSYEEFTYDATDKVSNSSQYQELH